MSRIRQMQRRAIEALAPHLHALEIKRGQRFYLNGKEIFFRGVSIGVGTCSDMRGVDFSVFSAIPNDSPSLPAKVKVAGAVFLRQARNREERERACAMSGQMILVVEALNPVYVCNHRIEFKRKRKKECYIPVIT